MLTSYDLEYVIKSPLYPQSEKSVIKVKSCIALLLMLLVCICRYIKSILIYKFLILDTYHVTQYIYVG